MEKGYAPATGICETESVEQMKVPSCEKTPSFSFK